MTRLNSIKIRTALVKDWARKIKEFKTTQEKLAKQAGISRVTISNAITGKYTPTETTVAMVEDAFGKYEEKIHGC